MGLSQMLRQGINPRFPHWIKVTRVVVNTDVNPPTSSDVDVFEGECRNYPSRSGSTGITEGVFISDYTVSMPFNEVLFETGDSVVITDRVKTFAGELVNSYNGNMGCTLWHNRVNN